MKKALLIVFVKHPISGQVKTRLAAGIGDEKALLAYQRLLAHTRGVIDTLPCKKVIFYGNKIPGTDLWSEAGYERISQEGPGLGERMRNAFAWGFAQGYEHIMIIGSDNAKISTEILTQGLLALQDHDAVIGPAKDGGYYCLGLAQMFEAVFENKKWSTDSVFSNTLRDFEANEKKFHTLLTLPDIDTKEDLAGTFLADLLD